MTILYSDKSFIDIGIRFTVSTVWKLAAEFLIKGHRKQCEKWFLDNRISTLVPFTNLPVWNFFENVRY